jgi:hypothetical protein
MTEPMRPPGEVCPTCGESIYDGLTPCSNPIHGTGQVATEQPDHSRDATKVMPTPPTQARELKERIANSTLPLSQLEDAFNHLIATQTRELEEELFRLASLIGCDPEDEARHRAGLEAYVQALITTEANRLAGEREAKQLGVFVADLYDLADGNTGEGIWDMYDKYATTLSAYPKGAPHG